MRTRRNGPRSKTIAGHRPRCAALYGAKATKSIAQVVRGLEREGTRKASSN